VAAEACRVELGQAFKTVWLVSFGFTGVGVVFGLLGLDTDVLLTDKIVVSLGDNRKKVEEKEGVGKVGVGDDGIGMG
jgi:hypothetical protein